jgi:hypothetical protein
MGLLDDAVQRGRDLNDQALQAASDAAAVHQESLDEIRTLARDFVVIAVRENFPTQPTMRIPKHNAGWPIRLFDPRSEATWLILVLKDGSWTFGTRHLNKSFFGNQTWVYVPQQVPESALLVGVDWVQREFGGQVSLYVRGQQHF